MSGCDSVPGCNCFECDPFGYNYKGECAAPREVNNPGWLVWNSQLGFETSIRPTFKHANDLALFLAESDPGQHFYVMEARGSYHTEAPPKPKATYHPTIA